MRTDDMATKLMTKASPKVLYALMSSRQLPNTFGICIEIVSDGRHNIKSSLTDVVGTQYSTLVYARDTRSMPVYLFAHAEVRRWPNMRAKVWLEELAGKWLKKEIGSMHNGVISNNRDMQGYLRSWNITVGDSRH